MPAGYSGTPLAKKLGFAKARQSPSWAPLRVSRSPTSRRAQRYGVQPAGPTDVTVWFVKSAAELSARIGDLATRAELSALWICWPKRASGVRSDVTEHAVRAAGLANGLVDFKIGAIDETWSGLRFAVARGRRERAARRFLRTR